LIDAQYKIIRKLQNGLGNLLESELRGAANTDSAKVIASLNESLAAAIAGLAALEKASGDYQARKIEFGKHGKLLA